MSQPAAFVQQFTPTRTPDVVAIRAAWRGVIRRLRVIQLSGAQGGFTYALYSRDAVRHKDGGGAYDGTLAADAELYRVTPDVVVPSGQSGAGHGTFDGNYAYVNQDGSHSSRLRSLYLAIVGGANKEFGISIVVDDPSGIT